ncbi:hypothetical protein CYMTET_27526 [Cymbomonas tetramitiformis]|uniref:Uncharacterized protein n=1 Tax=Cymbomonas tetramitiformis TaxID=36881 RepID=A0AAE0FPK0_9CHLO|nr:hypothetical protein CYMTET_27526 [Cymbomonas tetramitiformis]
MSAADTFAAMLQESPGDLFTSATFANYGNVTTTNILTIVHTTSPTIATHELEVAIPPTSSSSLPSVSQPPPAVASISAPLDSSPPAQPDAPRPPPPIRVATPSPEDEGADDVDGDTKSDGQGEMMMWALGSGCIALAFTLGYAMITLFLGWSRKRASVSVQPSSDVKRSPAAAMPPAAAQPRPSHPAKKAAKFATQRGAGAGAGSSHARPPSPAVPIASLDKWVSGNSGKESSTSSEDEMSAMDVSQTKAPAQPPTQSPTHQLSFQPQPDVAERSNSSQKAQKAHPGKRSRRSYTNLAGRNNTAKAASPAPATLEPSEEGRRATATSMKMVSAQPHTKGASDGVVSTAVCAVDG